MAMKLLAIDGLRFNLPDDFSGTLSDALRLAAEYIESDSPSLLNDGEKSANTWESYLDTVSKGGRISIMEQSIQSFDGEKWTHE